MFGDVEIAHIMGPFHHHLASDRFRLFLSFVAAVEQSFIGLA